MVDLFLCPCVLCACRFAFALACVAAWPFCFCARRPCVPAALLLRSPVWLLGLFPNFAILTDVVLADADQTLESFRNSSYRFNATTALFLQR